MLNRKIVSDKPAPLPSIYSQEFNWIVFKMLEKELTKRPDASKLLSYSPIALRIRLRDEFSQTVEKWVTFIILHSLQLDFERKTGSYTQYVIHKLSSCHPWGSSQKAVFSDISKQS